MNLEARASGRLSGDGVNAAVIDLRDCTARDADQVMVMGGLARDVGVSTAWQVNSFDEVLLGEEFEETEDGGASNTEAPLLGVGRGTSPPPTSSPTRDQGGKLTAWPGKAYPRLVKRLEQLSCHGGILSELRLSLNRKLGGRNRAH